MSVVCLRAPPVPLRTCRQIDLLGWVSALGRVERRVGDAVTPNQVRIDITHRFFVRLLADEQRDRGDIGQREPGRHGRHRSVSQRRDDEARRILGEYLAARRPRFSGSFVARRAARFVECGTVRAGKTVANRGRRALLRRSSRRSEHNDQQSTCNCRKAGNHEQREPLVMIGKAAELAAISFGWERQFEPFGL